MLIGAPFLAASAGAAFFAPTDFFHAYLIGYLLWLGVTLGAMALLMLQYLTGGAWGLITRRVFEAASRTLPLFVILFIPFVFGLADLYDWAISDITRRDPIVQHRSAYMNPAFFIGRSGIYFALWIALAFFLNRWSIRQDKGNELALQSRLAKFSAAGVIIYLFTISFASVDWAESLETNWASSIWGFLFISAEGVVALSFTIIVLAYLKTREPMSRILKPDHFHDLGKMLFANIMLWAYLCFVQYLIVWSENLTNEISYYRTRTGTSWGWLGLCLIVVEFAIPAVLLLSRFLKRNAYLLGAVAAVVFIMQYMYLVWIVLPSYYKNGFGFNWMDIVTPMGVGGVWLWVFLRELSWLPLLPMNAPGLKEAFAHETR
ncbi:MAG TPA: hypothetical protein VKX39_10760 [Bryobacteraceae bacterium]|jgi:hypothetical protein|nr:hypothetical protein [Bryobacteraceae bacterium]